MSTTRRKYIDEDWDLRIRASTAVRKFAGLKGFDDYDTLSLICRGEVVRGARFTSTFTDEDRYKCKLLVGPHGRSIFKMLVIKHNLTEFLPKAEHP